MSNMLVFKIAITVGFQYDTKCSITKVYSHFSIDLRLSKITRQKIV